MEKSDTEEKSPNQIAGDNFHLAIWTILTLSGLASTALAAFDNKTETANRLHIIVFGISGFVAMAIGLMMFVNSLFCRAIGKTEFNATEKLLGAWTVNDNEKADERRRVN